MSTRIKRYFVLSLILNVLFFGVIAGYIAHDMQHKKPFHKKRFGAELSEFIEQSSLPVEKRAELIKMIQKTTSEHNDMRDTRKAKQEALRILSAETFNEEEFRKKISERQKRFTSRRETMTDLIVAMASQMNQEERSKLAEHLRRMKSMKKPARKDHRR